MVMGQLLALSVQDVIRIAAKDDPHKGLLALQMVIADGLPNNVLKRELLPNDPSDIALYQKMLMNNITLCEQKNIRFLGDDCDAHDPAAIVDWISLGNPYELSLEDKELLPLVSDVQLIDNLLMINVIAKKGNVMAPPSLAKLYKVYFKSDCMID